MRVLIDESLPVELADELSEIAVATVHAAMAAIAERCAVESSCGGRITVILTGDQKLQHQQNLRKIGIGAVVVSGIRNRIEELRPLISRILEALRSVQAGEVIEIRPL